jgi:hypothetical protein
MNRFWRWLWSEYYSKTTVCQDCKAVGNKADMHHYPMYGWFCSNKEFEDFWLENQW